MISKYTLCLMSTIFVFLSFASHALAQVCTPPPADLVVWWPGDGDANDIVGTNNGTTQNGATFTAGKVGQAFSFDGVDDFVRVPDAPNLGEFSAVTIEAWIKTLNPADQDIVAHFDVLNPHPGFLFGLATTPGDTGVLHFFVADDTTPASKSSVGTVDDGEFHHVAVTYDSQTVKFYIDGVLDSMQSFAAPIVMGDPTNDLHIGVDTNALPGPINGPVRFFNGLIDELGIFNRVLSADEIADIHNADSAGKCQGDNLPPIAVAGTSLDGNNHLQLDGTLSSDPEMSPMTFSWQIEGEATPREGQIASIEDLVVDVYHVTLTVEDEAGNTDMDTTLLGVPEEVGVVPPPTPDVLQQQVRVIQTDIANFAVTSFDGPNENAQENRRGSLLNMLDNVFDAIGMEDYQGALDQLRDLLAKTDGDPQPADWIVDPDATTTVKEAVDTLISDILAVCLPDCS